MLKKTKLTADQKYRLLLQISHGVRDTLDLNEILNHILDTVHTILNYDAAGIFVLRRDIGRLEESRTKALIAGVAHRGFDPGPPEQDAMLTLGKGIIGHVIKSGESVLIPDVRNDSRYVVGRSETLSEIAVPIIRDDRSIGALNVESDMLSAFEDSDVEVLRFFATAAAIAIDRALLHLQILEKERMEEQLQIAHEVQSQLVPREAPDMAGYEFAGRCIPCFELGGDYFDYIPLSAGRLAVVVADVSGKGIPAALIMASFRALLRANIHTNSEPAVMGQILNCLLPESTRKKDFVASSYLILEPEGGGLSYANLGNTPPFIVRSDGGIEELLEGGPVLGAFRDAKYATGTVNLAKGDLLVLYTDGVVENRDGNDRQFGFERLTAVMQRSRHLPAERIIDEIIAETRAFCGSDRYADDFTLVVIRRRL